MQEKTKGLAKRKMTDAHLEEAARLFAILAESSRLKLLRALMDGQQTVTDLMATTGMRQANISKHLGVLLGARFVKRERDGLFVRYTISDARLATLCGLICDRIDADAQHRIAELKPGKRVR